MIPNHVKTISIAEALIISQQVMERAEKERKEVYEKEYEENKFWEDE